MPNLAVTSPGHAQCQVTQFKKLRFYSETYILARNIYLYRGPYEMIMIILMMMMMMMMMMMLRIAMMMMMMMMMMMKMMIMMMMMMLRASKR